MFQWWLYQVSHGQLLLRRARAADFENQVDVLFKDVVFVQAATCLNDLEVLSPDESELPIAIRRQLGGRRAYVLSSRDQLGYVCAGAVFHIETDDDYSDPTPLIQMP